jgi:hypothetical protein
VAEEWNSLPEHVKEAGYTLQDKRNVRHTIQTSSSRLNKGCRGLLFFVLYDVSGRTVWAASYIKRCRKIWRRRSAIKMV